jgi:hypothetical protein
MSNPNAAEDGKKGGRPKSGHTLATEAMRRFLIEKVNEEFGPIIQAQIDLAKGLHVIEQGKDGEVRRYQREPSESAAKQLVDQAIGRAKESIEVSGDLFEKLDKLEGETVEILKGIKDNVSKQGNI